MKNQAEYTIVDDRTIADKQSEIIGYYGMDKQLNQLVEESAELIVAIFKYQRYIPGGNGMDISFINEIIQELGDIKNLIGQLELGSDCIKEGIERTIEYKVNREFDRISTETKERLYKTVD